MDILGIIWGQLLLMLYVVRSWIRWFIPPKKKSVANETVLITGAGSGIGRLMAIEFAKLGAEVVLWDINKSGNEATARLVREIGGRAHTYVCDISNKDTVYEIAAKVKHDGREISILVNNAGIVSGSKFLDTPDDKIIKTMEINSLAHAWTLKCFLPDMLKNNHGHIVTIASIAGYVGAPGLADYCMSKYAAVGFHESIEREVFAAGADNVKFTLINPSLIKTGMFKGARLKHPEIIPPLSPEYVVERIMHAVLTNQKVMMIPRMLYFTVFMKSYLPAEILEITADTLRMDDFVGRTN